MNLVERARIFATLAHEAVGQVRKYTSEPYIVHPAEVASIVARVPHTREMLAAAWLHDVVEDTNVTNEEITQVFGDTVGELVRWLTDVSLPEMGNRAARKELDRNHIAQATADAQTVKLADIISNCSSIGRHDPDFATLYFAEKRAVLDVLTKGDPTLMAEARKIIGD